ncbi:MAG: 2Fe-2S iron-sulfur cluster-binding protein [Saprospiraceae bacterium]
MKNKFYTAHIKDIDRQYDGCVVLTFRVSDQDRQDFTFKSGQYLTLRLMIREQEVRRSYSICTPPKDEKLSVAIKKIDHGLFSTYANDHLRVGDQIDIMAPAGNFILEDINSKTFVFFSAGSGITPIMSQVSDILSSSSDSKIILFYGNRNFESVIFKTELEDLKDKYLHRLSIHHIFSQEKGNSIFRGRIDKKKCEAFSKVLFDIEATDYFMICGPYEMTFDIKNQLTEMGVEPSKIKFELFNTDGIKAKSTAQKIYSKSNTTESNIKIKMDGDIFEFHLPSNGQNLLDAAIENGADLPYSCKGGVCSTCRAKLIEGEVKMDINYALEKDELDAGFILMCQAHPNTKNIYIDFDQK